jgi:ParB-like nuclease family protein
VVKDTRREERDFQKLMEPKKLIHVSVKNLIAANYKKILDPKKVDELVDSYRSVGQLVPIGVAQRGKKYEIRFGHHRTAACAKAHRKVIALVMSAEDDPAKVEEALIAESTIRISRTPQEVREMFNNFASSFSPVGKNSLASDGDDSLQESKRGRRGEGRPRSEEGKKIREFAKAVGISKKAVEHKLARSKSKPTYPWSATAAALRGASKLCTKASAMLQKAIDAAELESAPLAQYLRDVKSDVFLHLEKARIGIESSTPYAPCPHCGANGHRCQGATGCEGFGWMTKLRFDRVPEDIREKAQNESA